MNKKKVLFLSFLFFLFSCATKIKKDYVVVDVSATKKPLWVKEMKFEDKKSEYKFFVSKSENINQRISEKSASSRGAVLIASEIANSINDQYEESAKNNEIEKQEYSSEKLTQNIKNYIAGIENDSVYWEKRNYKKSLGAENDISKYTYYVLLKIKKDIYNKAVDLSVEKMFNEISTDKKDDLKQEIKQEILSE